MFSDRDRRTFLLSRRNFLSLGAGATAFVASRGNLLALASSAPSSSSGPTFLDASVVHDISVTFDQTIYDAMIQELSDTGKKDWIEATLTIDGATYEKVGMRLKGNSSLGALRAPGGENGPRNQAFMEVDGTPVAIDPNSLEFPTIDGTPVGNDTQFIVRGGGGSQDVSADKPEGLPWLIRLDKYQKDQNHNGMTQLVIRSNGSATSLNEAVSLDLLARAGLASQLAAYAGFSANASTPALRLAIENPDSDWMKNHFSETGLLFKSEATGDWSFRGDDPTSYDDVFDLEAGGSGDDADDFKPLTDFLDFVNNSDDTTFAAELPSRLDVERFAIYLAMMKLIDNFDDISGPGNNSYLYFAPVSEEVTIVPWDMNLAFSGMGNATMKGGGRSGGGPVITRDDTAFGSTSSPDATPVAGQDGSTDQGDGGFTGPPGMSNPLVTRFNAMPEFSALPDEQMTKLRSDLYDSGVAAGILSARVAVLENGASSMLDKTTIESESETIMKYFTTS